MMSALSLPTASPPLMFALRAELDNIVSGEVEARSCDDTIEPRIDDHEFAENIDRARAPGDLRAIRPTRLAARLA